MIAPPSAPVTVLDLPGTYSLTPKSLDEQIARDALFHRLADVPPPSLVVIVVDASNLERNLYFATQVLELGYPTLVALNMMDVAAENGHEIDLAALGQRLGAPVFPLVASAGEGIEKLRAEIIRAAAPGVYVSLSCDVNPEWREYERTASTVANAYIGPPVSRYLDGLEKLVKSRFPDCRTLMMKSDGGAASAASAPRSPKCRSPIISARFTTFGPGSTCATRSMVAGGMGAIRFDDDGTLEGASCWRADGHPIGLGHGYARPGVRFRPEATRV